MDEVGNIYLSEVFSYHHTIDINTTLVFSFVSFQCFISELCNLMTALDIVMIMT